MRKCPVVVLLVMGLVEVGCPGGLPTEGLDPDGHVPQKFPDLGSQDFFQTPHGSDVSIGDGASADQFHAADQDQAASSQDQLTQAPDQTALAGKWYQANEKNCPTFCAGIGRQNAAGPEGAHCMSGEVRSASGIAQGITFPWGCWPSCLPLGPHTATSHDEHCYMPGQKQDDDDTDRTVGCFCI